MGVKVQYNPSTGKASYNPATGKVQVVVDDPPVHECLGCDNPPNEIDVTISGVTALCCTATFDNQYSTALNAAFLAEINKTHRIPIITSFTDRCVWFVTDDVYTGGDCINNSPYKVDFFGPSTPAPGCGGTAAFSTGIESISYTYNALSDGSSLFRISSTVCGASNRVNQIWSSSHSGGSDDCMPTSAFTETLVCPISASVNAQYILTGGTISISAV
jgi:hypothetical protein